MPIPVLLWRLRRNRPPFAATFSACPMCAVGSGRGGGPCWDCLRAELVRRIGEQKAERLCRRIIEDTDRLWELRCGVDSQSIS